MNHYSERVDDGRCGVLVHKQKTFRGATKSDESLQKKREFYASFFNRLSMA